MMRKTVTIYVPDGYKDKDEFLKDCAFEEVDWGDDAWTITSRNKWKERLYWSAALLFDWPKR